MSTNGSGSPERLTSSDNIQVPGSWSPSGDVLLFVEQHPTTGRDIWMLRYGTREVAPFLRTSFDESAPRFSPDGRSVAYVSNQSGRNEVYVRSFPDASPAGQASRGGGTEPVWAPAGGELFYRSGDQLMAVEVLARSGVRIGAPRAVLNGPYERGTVDRANYDVLPGHRFVFVQAAEQTSSASELHVVLNWLETARSLLTRQQR